MNTQRLKHLSGLLGAMALAVLPVWADAQAPLAAKIALTITTALALLFSAAKVRHASHAIMGGLALAGTIGTLILAKLPAGETGAAVAGTAVAVLTQLRVIFARDFGPVPEGDDEAITKPETPSSKAKP